MHVFQKAHAETFGDRPENGKTKHAKGARRSELTLLNSGKASDASYALRTAVIPRARDSGLGHRLLGEGDPLFHRRLPESLRPPRAPVHVACSVRRGCAANAERSGAANYAAKEIVLLVSPLLV